jgi:hypothetical protein
MLVKEANLEVAEENEAKNLRFEDKKERKSLLNFKEFLLHSQRAYLLTIFNLIWPECSNL